MNFTGPAPPRLSSFFIPQDREELALGAGGTDTGRDDADDLDGDYLERSPTTVEDTQNSRR